MEETPRISEEHPGRERRSVDDPATIDRSKRIEARVSGRSAGSSTPAEIRRSKRMEARQGH